MNDLVIDPIVPVGVVIALGIGLALLTVVVYWRVGSSIDTRRNLVLLILRLLGVTLLLILLLQPSRAERVPPPVTNRVTLIGVDNSQSMAQSDVEQGTRAQAARSILAEAAVVTASGEPVNSQLRLFKFSETASQVLNTAQLDTSGGSTRIHTSITNILASLRGNEGARALILLSDGHDFELVNAAKTGFNARARQTPIYAVALGKQGKVRDVSARIASYQPYCYVKQKARISSVLRLIGCELETVTVRLLREGTVVQTQQVRTGEGPEVAVNFDVTELAVGQYEYEVQAVPLEGEIDRENNHALTFLNVIDQQIQVLFLEGAPFWDTTFFQRSLMRNDKMNVDSIVQYAQGKARIVRKRAGEKEMKIPATPEEWRRYDVIVLGRSVDKLLGVEGLHQLEDYVQNHAGTVIFSRGRAFEGDLAKNDLEPVVWGDAVTEHVRLKPSREGLSVAPFRLLSEQGTAMESAPELIAARAIAERKPLAATLATAEGAAGGEPVAAMIQRRFGEGQVLSVSVDGLWRWAFNARIEGNNTLFDRFWDQMILWLMAGRDFLPAQQFALRASSANIPLGEKIAFRAVIRDSVGKIANLPLTVSHDGGEVGRTTLAGADPNSPDKLVGEFLPAKPGRYEAAAQFPDGSKQKVRFIVFDENLEQTEVATDSTYLRRLCESSGGRLLEPSELGRLIKELGEESVEATPQTRLVSVWDAPSVFWLIGLFFGADWFLRRRWGLC
ncbi:MAG: hypothetical protein JWL59_1822 [Chthoniobacteraceae bacterium]|nr:hypothetical protein [Chthoniobacteraceae bacterium]